MIQGGATTGGAKSVNLISVKVLDSSGSGTLDGITAGLNYVVTQKKANPSRPAVASMSLGFSSIVSSADSAVQTAIINGITCVIAAGNDNIDACGNSPGRVSTAITVREQLHLRS